MLAVKGARILLNMPYYAATMTVAARAGRVDYSSRRRKGRPAELVGSYGPTGSPSHPAEGSLEYFLTERYCLYNVNRRGRPFRLDIHHPPWPLQPAEATFTRNTMTDAGGFRLPPEPPLLHFATRQDVVAWPPVRV
jgi:uncharacterized protein